MEFERLSRRELQALCKANKIPANITNVAMVDALKALSFVEGIGEFMQPSQSETAQSSIESPEGKEVTSPRLPPTGGRTTRRRIVAKEEPGTLQPTTRTRRATRKALAKDPDEAKADITETPSVVQATRRTPLASVCRKMESQLQECEDDEKKDALVTPAPAGVTSRRRRGVKEESVVKREYSTRRSARLAEKKVEAPDEVEKEKSTLFKGEAFTKDGEDVKMNFEECLDNVGETSRGIDANTTVEKNPGEIDESEVVSAIKHHMQIGEQSDFEATIENVQGEDKAEDVPAQQATTFAEEIGQKSDVVGLKLDGEKVLLKSAAFGASTNMEGKDELEVVLVEESNGTTEEEMGHYIEADCLKCEFNEAKDLEDEEVCFGFEIEVDPDVINEAQESKEHMDTSKETGIEDNACDTDENIVLETEDKIAADISADTEICNEIEKDICESHDMDPENFPDFNMNEQILEIIADVHLNVCEMELNLDESSKSIIVEANEQGNDEIYQVTDDAMIDMASEIRTPYKASATKATPTAKRMSILSDNKENVGSGSIVVALTKERVNVKKLEDTSVRKLTKMLKEKLQITNKLSNNENGNETRGRPALQALPENRLVDETQN